MHRPFYRLDGVAWGTLLVDEARVVPGLQLGMEETSRWLERPEIDMALDEEAGAISTKSGTGTRWRRKR